MQQRDDWMAQVTTCIKYCLHWTGFSETRWAGVGPSSRKLLRSLVVGVKQLAKQAQASDAVMNWHLNGFNLVFVKFPKESNDNDSCSAHGSGSQLMRRHPTLMRCHPTLFVPLCTTVGAPFLVKVGRDVLFILL